MKSVFLTPILLAVFSLSLWAQSDSRATIKPAAASTQQASAPSPSDDQRDNLSWIALHTRLMLASPNYTFDQVPTLDYRYADFRTANLGGSVKLQLLNFLYGEYALCSNLYSQRTNLVVAGIETPTKIMRLGLRYQWTNDGFAPTFGEDHQNLQVYINLGGSRGGIEVALGKVDQIINASPSSLSESLSLTNIQIRLNIPIWSSKR